MALLESQGSTFSDKSKATQNETETPTRGCMLVRMTREMIVQVWEAEGAKFSGQGVTIREEREATCFIQSSGEVMTIARITKMELRDGFLSLQTAKDERYVFAYEDVLGFKLSSPSMSKERPAGFGR